MALSDIFTSFNWLDILVIIVLVRIAYTAFKTGLPQELFKLLGTVLATYFSLHYYIVFSAALSSLKNISPETINFIFILVLIFLGYIFFVILRKIFFRVINVEAENKINVWGGLALGLVRGLLAAGLITYVFAISPVGYFRASAKKSFFTKELIKVAPATYTFLWDGIMSKFMAKEEFNKAVGSTQEGLGKK